MEGWRGFAAQKNYALDKATGDWILSLDADEEVEPLAMKLATTSSDKLENRRGTEFRIEPSPSLPRQSPACGFRAKTTFSAGGSSTAVTGLTGSYVFFVAVRRDSRIDLFTKMCNSKDKLTS